MKNTKAEFVNSTTHTIPESPRQLLQIAQSVWLVQLGVYCDEHVNLQGVVSPRLRTQIESYMLTALGRYMVPNPLVAEAENVLVRLAEFGA